MKTIILASQSPRRKELLQQLITQFEIIPANIDETVEEGLLPEEYVQKMAFEKARCVLNEHPESLVIGCDTVVVLDNKILGKPKTHQEAKAMLLSYSDRTHQVLTGVTIMTQNKVVTKLAEASVTFYPLHKEQVEQYVATGEPMDKSGSYGIQGGASVFVKEIHGDFYAIVGFPVGLVNQLLQEF